MSVSFANYNNRVVFSNLNGTYAVWKQVASDITPSVVGPGYIGRVILGSGKRPCDGYIDPKLSVNDPSIQGVGIAGWHHYRDLPDEPNIWNKGWDMGGHRNAGADPFGVSGCSTDVPFRYKDESVIAGFRVDFVDRYSAAENKRIATVRYDYIVEPRALKCWVTFTEYPDGPDGGPRPFLKEPKYAVGIGGSSYKPRTLTVYGYDRIDLATHPRLQNPRHGTIQVRNTDRCRLSFSDGTDRFNVTARACRPDGIKPLWANGAHGLDGFAADANSRDRLSDEGGKYCLQGPDGTLSRNWEIAKRHGDPRVEVMLHGWEGGTGLPDCLCAARAYSPGKAWTNYLEIT